MNAEFAHLHVHSEYSLLDGLAHAKRLAARAREYNQPALAITDHGTMFAAIEFHDACKAQGVKPLIGIETYLAARTRHDRDNKLDRSSFHLLLLAENETGYKNLLKLASLAQLEGFYYYPRVDKQALEQYADGVIATTGCLAAEIPQLLVQGKREQARETLDWYRQIFKDRFYVELQDHGIADLTRINPELIALAQEFNLKTVATNDVHYIGKDDWSAQDILLCIQTGNLVSTSDRMRMDGRDYYFKSSDEMAEVWREQPTALQTTLEIAERCNVDLSFKGYRLPHFPVPEGFTTESYLRVLTEQGYAQRYGHRDSPELHERLNYELGVIHRMGFDTYFLIVWDLTRHAREKGIWFNARGSAAGSIVSYCLGITNLDPTEHNLIFERFLNPDRISMPDIDLDFPDDARAEMIRYTVDKYGRDNVAQIITFGKMLAKAALRDVGRALDYPLADVDRVAKLIPLGPGQTIDGALENIKEFRELYETSDYLRKLIDTAKQLEGVARNASTHAAGVVVTDQPVVEYVPLHRPTKGDESGFPVTQFPMGDIEHIGLLKIDYLGLATLTIMRRACELIERRHGIQYTLANIPVEDEEAFKLLSRGDVVGVFQVEGGGMKRVLTQMKPNKFDHIVATISLYRPGPMEYIPQYIARLHGDEKVEYRHLALEPILGETFGILIYQEQIIRIARDLCGYSGGEADTLRKAVGKKNKEAILKQREQFIEGAERVGIIPAQTAAQIFDDIEFFARYGFNKSHAAVYGVMTCQTAYLKAHYALEYMTALMITDTGNIEKIALFVAEARRMGIQVLPPDIRYSEVAFSIQQPPTSDGAESKAEGIRFGLSAIKNVGEGAVQVIVEARGDEPFASLDDFCRRVDLRQVNRRVLESLIKAGAFDAFGHRAQLLAVVERMLSVSASHHQASAMGQMSFFGGALQADTFGELPKVKAVEHREKLEWEKELIGVYFSPHPLLKLAETGKQYVSTFVGDLTEESDGQQVTLGGIIQSVRTITTKKGAPMAFIQLEDPQGAIEVVAFPRTYNESRDLLRDESLVLVRGKVQVREGKLAVLADSISAYPIEAAPSDSVDKPDRPLPNILEKTPVLAPAPVAGATVMPSSDETRFDDEWIPLPEEWDIETDSGNPAAKVIVAQVDAASESTPTESSVEEHAAPQENEVKQGEPEANTSPPAPAPTMPTLTLSSGIQIPSKSGNGGNGKPAPASLGPAALPIVRDPQPTYAAASSGGRVIRVKIQRSDDADDDVRRLRELIKLLRSVQGRDRFALIVPNMHGIFQLDFPNYYTNYDALAPQLGRVLGDWADLEME